MKNPVEFFSYDGEYPNLCSGKLVLRIGSKKYTSFELISGGTCSIDDDGVEEITNGEWNVNTWPCNFPKERRQEALNVINANIPGGCCGGCI